jgi:hypothetical protein
MVKRAFVFDSDLAGHAGTFIKIAAAVSTVRTTRLQVYRECHVLYRRKSGDFGLIEPTAN